MRSEKREERMGRWREGEGGVEGEKEGGDDEGGEDT